MAMVMVGGHLGWPLLVATGLAMQVGVGRSSLGAYLYTLELSPTWIRAWATSTGSSWIESAPSSPVRDRGPVGVGTGHRRGFAMFGLVAVGEARCLRSGA